MPKILELPAVYKPKSVKEILFEVEELKEKKLVLQYLLTTLQDFLVPPEGEQTPLPFEDMVTGRKVDITHLKDIRDELTSWSAELTTEMDNLLVSEVATEGMKVLPPPEAVPAAKKRNTSTAKKASKKAVTVADTGSEDKAATS